MRIAVALTVAILAAGVLALMAVARLDGPGDRALPVTVVSPHPLRIVALGTSLTRRALWPDRLAETLGRCLPAGTSVVRVARPGMGSAWALGQVGIIAAERPDLVIVELAINDADVTDGLWLGQSRDNHRALIRALRAASPDTEVLLLTTNPVSRRARLTRPFLALYQRLYGELADSEGAGLVDGYGRWLRHRGPDTDLGDGVHPDPASEADLYTAPLVQAIAEAFALSCP